MGTPIHTTKEKKSWQRFQMRYSNHSVTGSWNKFNRYSLITTNDQRRTTNDDDDDVQLQEIMYDRYTCFRDSSSLG